MPGRTWQFLELATSTRLSQLMNGALIHISHHVVRERTVPGIHHVLK